MGDNMPADPVTDLAAGAAQLHEAYEEFIAAGFTEAQAMQMVCATLTGNPGRRVMNGWSDGDSFTVKVMPDVWVPYSAELAVDLIGWPVEQVRDVFGETILVRQTFGGLEFGRPDPAPDSDEVRAEVAEIIEQGIISPAEQTRWVRGPAPCLPDQLRRDLIAVRDGAWSA